MVRFRLIGKRPKIRFDAKRGKIAKRRRGSRLCTLKNRLVIHDGIARALRMHYMTRSFALCQWWPTTDTGRDHSRRRSSTTKYTFVLSRMNSRGLWHVIISRVIMVKFTMTFFELRSTSLCHPEWILAGSPHRSLDPWRPTNKPIQPVCHVCAPPAQCGAIRILVQLDMP